MCAYVAVSSDETATAGAALGSHGFIEQADSNKPFHTDVLLEDPLCQLPPAFSLGAVEHVEKPSERQLPERQVARMIRWPLSGSEVAQPGQ